ncbi:MAG: hypothetical protein JW819_10415 [Candidatus Krumholzibacteriota bacterium]|nr:hypothetical protein [Candidatus Krumholzibacteriota bacterium]
MDPRRWRAGGVCLAAALLALAAACRIGEGTPRGPSFRVTLGDSVAAEPVAGRLFVLLDRNLGHNPLFGPYGREPLYALDVDDWRPGDARLVDRKAASFPVPLDSLPAGRYVVRAVLDRDREHRSFSWAPGNLYTARLEIRVEPFRREPFELVLDRIVPEERFEERLRARELVVESPLLSDFAGAPRFLRAAVILPASYIDDPERRYPTVYVIPGWGATHHAVNWGDHQQRRYGMADVGVDKVFVFLNPETRRGHHGFADSDNCGPWGRALVEEMIPAVEARYRVIRDHETRFLAGQSSGGWGALWVQIHYPEAFGGAWAASPDYVDFRRFAGVDLAAPGANLYVDEAGRERPAERDPATGAVVLTRREAWRREALIGEGGQWGSFEAVFGPRGEDGEPRPLFDRATGAVDPVTAAAWERYDLGRILRARWPELAPRLAGRLHVVAAADDPWGLAEPLALLAADLAAMDADVDIRILATGAHDVWTDETRRRMHAEMDARVRAAGH